MNKIDDREKAEKYRKRDGKIINNFKLSNEYSKFMSDGSAWRLNHANSKDTQNTRNLFPIPVLFP